MNCESTALPPSYCMLSPAEDNIRKATTDSADNIRKATTDSAGGGSSNSSCSSSSSIGSSSMQKACLWCGYSSIRISDLMSHMKTSHPQEYSANEGESTAAAGEDNGTLRRYKCFSCEARFCRSGTLMDHVRRNHPDVCAPAERARPFPLPPSITRLDGGGDDKVASVVPLDSVMCHYCRINCLTRKRLMQHMEAVHAGGTSSSCADEDDDEEPDIKVIRVASLQSSSALSRGGGDGYASLFGSLPISRCGKARDDQRATLDVASGPTALRRLLGALRSAEGSDSSSVAYSSVSAGLSGDDSVGIHVVRLGSDRPGSVTGGGLRASDKRYKCFWCDAHFRKRGKLMDHIDLFHKDSKQQIEVEAELLSGSSPPVGGTGPADSWGHKAGPAEPNASVGSLPDSTLSRQAYGGGAHPMPLHAMQGAGVPSVSLGKLLPTCPSLPCRFFLRASMHKQFEPRSEVGTRRKAAVQPCKFYFGKLSNPLTAVSTASRTASAGNDALPPGAPATAIGLGMPLSVTYGQMMQYPMYCGVRDGTLAYYQRSSRADLPCSLALSSYHMTGTQFSSLTPGYAHSFLPAQESVTGVSPPSQKASIFERPLDLSSRNCRT